MKKENPEPYKLSVVIDSKVEPTIKTYDAIYHHINDHGLEIKYLADDHTCKMLVINNRCWNAVVCDYDPFEEQDIGDTHRDDIGDTFFYDSSGETYSVEEKPRITFHYDDYSETGDFE